MGSPRSGLRQQRRACKKLNTNEAVGWCPPFVLFEGCGALAPKTRDAHPCKERKDGRPTREMGFPGRRKASSGLSVGFVVGRLFRRGVLSVESSHQDLLVQVILVLA
jgi:hypothetical protein